MSISDSFRSGSAGRVGREVSLVSVSVDPVIDTPERLKDVGRAIRRIRGWTLLTGQKQDVDHFLKALGVFAANKTEHSPFILIGRAIGWPLATHSRIDPGRQVVRGDPRLARLAGA